MHVRPEKILAGTRELGHEARYAEQLLRDVPRKKEWAERIGLGLELSNGLVTKGVPANSLWQQVFELKPLILQ